jgi:peptidoglycan hydrolase CwlO-like protein
MPEIVSAMLPLWAWIVGAVLVIVIVLNGSRMLQMRQRLQTMESVLLDAKHNAAKANDQVAGLEKQAADLQSELDKEKAARSELQSDFDQAAKELKLTKSQLDDEQSRLEAVQSELKDANQAANQSKTEAAQLQERVTSLSSELEKANAQRNELQTKLDQATTEIKSTKRSSSRPTPRAKSSKPS